MEKQDLISVLNESKGKRQDLEIYIDYLLVQKFLWRNLYNLLRGMVFSNIADISARTERIINQYNSYLSLIKEIEDHGEHAILVNTQFNQIKLKIDKMREELGKLTNFPELRNALEFYDKL